ncbi:hypothetical protein BDZ90DRAFT_231776 [Jaminaea rosea]|uniref:Uncharacterized protein n=1 Tax=Jaminaea rosea TaxID=1569628 RepID=A0A316URR4_9BASI|nr:hypothetical protein BDZ90DRAFT_231776 [Jaminaea rosea]PWN28010.1 hypothetical protein BDZ90DRAFT_231776 [Jaminaea rosea]
MPASFLLRDLTTHARDQTQWLNARRQRAASAAAASSSSPSAVESKLTTTNLVAQQSGYTSIGSMGQMTRRYSSDSNSSSESGRSAGRW